MVDLAKTLNNDADMIKFAQIFAQQPRNTVRFAFIVLYHLPYSLNAAAFFSKRSILPTGTPKCRTQGSISMPVRRRRSYDVRGWH
jgi:hypothetical protein